MRWRGGGGGLEWPRGGFTCAPRAMSAIDGAQGLHLARVQKVGAEQQPPHAVRVRVHLPRAGGRAARPDAAKLGDRLAEQGDVGGVCLVHVAAGAAE